MNWCDPDLWCGDAASPDARYPRVINAASPAYEIWVEADGQEVHGFDLQAAVSSLPPQGGGLVLLPPHELPYLVLNPPLRIRSVSPNTQRPTPRSNLRIVGGGPASRVVPLPGATWPGQGESEPAERALIEIRAYATDQYEGLDGAKDVILENFAIDGQDIRGIIGVRIHQSGRLGRLRNLTIENCPAAGVCFQLDSNSNVLDSLLIGNCGTGIRIAKYLPWSEMRKNVALWCPGGSSEPDLDRELAEPEDLEQAPPGCYYFFTDRHAGWRGDPPVRVTDRSLFYAQPGMQASNSVMIINSKILDCALFGVRIHNANNVCIVNCDIENAGWNGVTACYTAGLVIEGCRFVHNGFAHLRDRSLAIYPAADSPDRALAPEEILDALGKHIPAQVLLGDPRRHPPEPGLSAADPWSQVLGRSFACYPSRIAGCQFDGRDATDTERVDIGILVGASWSTLIQGCRLEGHARAPIWLDSDRTTYRAVILGNSFPGQEPMRGRGFETRNYDHCRLRAVRWVARDGNPLSGDPCSGLE